MDNCTNALRRLVSLATSVRSSILSFQCLISSDRRRLGLLLGPLPSMHPSRMFVQRFWTLMTGPTIAVFAFFYCRPIAFSFPSSPEPIRLFYGRFSWCIVPALAIEELHVMLRLTVLVVKTAKLRDNLYSFRNKVFGKDRNSHLPQLWENSGLVGVLSLQMQFILSIRFASRYRKISQLLTIIVSMNSSRNGNKLFWVLRHRKLLCFC